MIPSELTEEEKMIQKEIVVFLRENFVFIMKNKYFTKARKLSMCALKFSVHTYSYFPKLQEANYRKNS